MIALKKILLYVPVFVTFSKDSFLRFKNKSFIIIISGFVGSAFQVAAVGQIIYFAKLLESGNNLQFLTYSFDPRTQEFFFVFIFFMMFFLITSSALIYYSNSKIIDLAVEYEAFCSKRISHLIARMSGGVIPGWLSIYDEKSLSRLATSDSRFCGRVLRLLVKLFQPTITFLYCRFSRFVSY